jgi:DNA-binding CsgD family transcriptional regulator
VTDPPRTLSEEVFAGNPLTERELETLELAATGRSASDTGGRLHLSSETVKGYRKRIIAKLAARNLTHAVVIAVGMGYINIEAVVEEHERRMADLPGRST